MATKASSFVSKSFLALHRAVRRRLTGRRHRQAAAKPCTPRSPPLEKLQDQTVVVDVEAWLLRSPLSTFPYFMLVAIEAGGFLRCLLLLLLCPFLPFLGGETRLKAMVMVAFAGLPQDEVVRVGKAVLPKYFLQEVAVEGLEAVRKARTVVAVSAAFPRVMVEGFLKEYLGVAAVVGREVKAVSGVLVGLVAEEEMEVERLRGLLGEEMAAVRDGGAVGLVGGRSHGRQHLLFSRYCKETYTLSEADKKAWQPLPRDKYPKPLVFHDGRLAFLPTPSAAVAMYTFLPLSVALAVVRIIAFSLLPYHVSVPLGALTGIRSRLIAGPALDSTTKRPGLARGRLYVCNHRTLLDPVTVAAAVGTPLTAVTYSVSPLSEMISPVRTARLSRNRQEDRRSMEALLARGDLVVCPEGTTCREPYLLRFSPLFAELAAEVTPVALDTRVDMFYGTSTKPAAKWMDPFYFMMNSRPEYRIEFLAPVATAAPTDGRNGSHGHSIDVANQVQHVLGEALGFECTELTRKHKYMILAGNEGFVKAEPK